MRRRRPVTTGVISPFVFNVSRKLAYGKMPDVPHRTASMSEFPPQPVFLKDLHQPFFLKELASTVADGPPIDMRHLAPMTCGERHLEFQVLELFDRQAEMLLGCMRDAGAAEVASIAHTLAQSAREIGARRVAEAAHALERAIVENREFASTLQTLDCAVVEARLATCAMLRTWLLPRRPQAGEENRAGARWNQIRHSAASPRSSL